MAKKIWRGFLIALGAMVWAVLITLWFLRPDPDPSDVAEAEKSRAEASFRTSAIAWCSSAIKESLKNPDSAEWVGRPQWPVRQAEGNLYLVTATYRATNSFGGVITEQTDCLIVRDGKDARVIRRE